LPADETVSLEKLAEAKQGQVLCYPRCEQEELVKRLKELESLGVQGLEFTGKMKISGITVRGKGYVGVVVVAHTKRGRAALKIRRIDADRNNMFHEAEMLKKANSLDVGPKLLKESKNFLLMELIEGAHFPEWVESLEEKSAEPRFRLVLTKIIEQCYKLDESGLDHGELSNAPKHIIVSADNSVHLIDFETSSINRRVSNVTSVCQYLFMGSKIADKVNEKLGKLDKKELKNLLRTYKHEQTRENFEKILEQLET